MLNPQKEEEGLRQEGLRKVILALPLATFTDLSWLKLHLSVLSV